MYKATRACCGMQEPCFWLLSTLKTVISTIYVSGPVAKLALHTCVNLLPAARLTLQLEFRQHCLIRHPPPCMHLIIVCQALLFWRIGYQIQKRFGQGIALDLVGGKILIRLGRFRPLVPRLVEAGVSSSCDTRRTGSHVMYQPDLCVFPKVAVDSAFRLERVRPPW